jgi:ParB family transcriptional regulator, chromosome partitioning protein
MNLAQTNLFGTPESARRDYTKDDRYTPRFLVESARAALGGVIDCDPASCAEANTVVQAGRFYSVADDGLQQPWFGAVLLNPPYSDPLPWIQRLVQSYRSGAVRCAVVIVPCASSPEWAQLLSRHAAACCFLAQRVQFWPRRPGDTSNAADNLIWYVGTERDRFAGAFAPHGIVR